MDGILLGLETALQPSNILICLLGVTLAVVGGALWLKATLAGFLRYWMARLVYEQGAQTDQAADHGATGAGTRLGDRCCVGRGRDDESRLGDGAEDDVGENVGGLLGSKSPGLDHLVERPGGARSAAVCHLGNLAYWHDRRLKWDPKKEQIIGDAEAARLLTRTYRDPWKLEA